jgi:hypothetical protein
MGKLLNFDTYVKIATILENKSPEDITKDDISFLGEAEIASINEGIFSWLKNKISWISAGGKAAVDAILGPNGSLTGAEKKYLTAETNIDGKIAEMKVKARSSEKGSTDIIAYDKNIEGLLKLKASAKRAYDANKALFNKNLDDLIKKFASDKKITKYITMCRIQLEVDLAEMEYKLREKFTSDQELEKYKIQLSKAQANAKKISDVVAKEDKDSQVSDAEYDKLIKDKLDSDAKDKAAAEIKAKQMETSPVA